MSTTTNARDGPQGRSSTMNSLEAPSREKRGASRHTYAPVRRTSAEIAGAEPAAATGVGGGGDLLRQEVDEHGSSVQQPSGQSTPTVAAAVVAVNRRRRRRRQRQHVVTPEHESGRRQSIDEEHTRQQQQLQQLWEGHARDSDDEAEPKLRLQHGTVIRLDRPLTESEFKRRHHIKKSRYKKVGNIDDDDEAGGGGGGGGGGGAGASPGGSSRVAAHAGEARISSRQRQTCLQYMLACAAKREWSFWSTTTFFIGCWMNITLAAIDIIGESFGTYANVTYNYTYENGTGVTTVSSYVVTEILYSEDELALYEDEGSAYNWINTISCTLFVINPIFDWLYAFFNSPGYTTPLQASPPWLWLSSFAWGFWCPLWFFVASILYLTLALDGIWNWRRKEDLLILNIWASHLFIVDAVCALIVWRIGGLRARGTRGEVFMFAREFEKIDWCGWGDWLFLAGALVDSSNAYVYEVAYSLADRANFVGSILWTLDCVCYFFADKIAKDQAKRALHISRHQTTTTGGVSAPPVPPVVADDNVTIVEVRSHHDDASSPIERPRVDKAVGHPKAVVTIGFSSSDESGDDEQNIAGASVSRASSSSSSAGDATSPGAWSHGTTAADIVAQDLQVDPDGDSDSSV